MTQNIEIEVKLPDFELDLFLPYLLTEAAEKLSHDLAAIYRDAGLSTPQWRVMVHLSYSGQVSVRDIERRVSMEKSKVSRAAARLELAGLVAKRGDPDDGRLVALGLTEAGRALMAQLLPRAIDYQRQLEATLGADLPLFHKALSRLLNKEAPE
ncbi:MarR family transcriptional regulator [Thioclava dalianensis]|uniref:MarR family transcriptional regulator n=1 Tax=Thioclava dalianensis TaxID=1185766 RepID=A0A074TJ70_9RHOB|nr:MarR family transcriptional regulator [Thioclava dalianensis]SFN40148.1 DNA-binding transcriptional regulator, MarR family [Thioclava dalianensis]